MKKYETIRQENQKPDVGAPNESWEEHVAFAERLKRKFFREKIRKTGEEKSKPDAYLLSEHMKIPENPRLSRKEQKSAQKWFKEVYEHWDNCGIELPRELGEGIESIVNDKNYFFGVHRSSIIDGSNFEKDEDLHSILTEGLHNLGDASSGIVYKDPPVSKTVSPCNDMLHAVINLKTSYKGSTGAVLVVIPSDFVDKNTGNVKDGMEDVVYNHNNHGNSIIKPEFIMGFVQNLGPGSVLKYKSREAILEAYEKNKME